MRANALDNVLTKERAANIERETLRARLAAGLAQVQAMDERLIDEGLLEPDAKSLDGSLIRAALAEGDPR